MKKNQIKFAFLLPAVVWVLAFTIFPLIYSVRLSFFSYRLGRGETFVGGRNFVQAFTYPRFWGSLQTTFSIVLVAVGIEILLGLLFAWHFNREVQGDKVFRTLITLPLFATPVAVGYLGITLFYETSGPINMILSLFNIHVPWLSHPFWAKVSVILLDVWIWTPFCFLVFLAGFHTISEEIYEAAYMDTNSELQIFRHITLPLLLPILGIVIALRLVEAFKVFDVPYSLLLGGPGTSTEVYPLLVYRTALKNFDFGSASALSLILLAIVMCIVIIFFRQLRKVYE